MKKSELVICMLLLINSMQVFPQTGIVKGFVYEASSLQPVPFASISLVGTKTGAVTDPDGFFLFTHVPVGSQVIKVSCLGFEDYLKNVMIRPDVMEQLVIYLKPHIYELQIATINAERLRMERMNTVSAHHLTQETLKRIPGLTGQSDLAEYLQVIPGIIFTGDRGGQFYVRGGASVQNLVKIDGITVINPFHSVGFASVFDTETIGSVDVYTAGFSARYGGRTSSVIDIRTRIGNRREFKAKTSASTFGYGFMVEGPLKKMTEKDPSSVSVILYNKGSYINKTAGLVYPYLDSTGIPFNYNDFFGKVSLIGRKGDQLDLIGMHFTDAADYTGLMHSSWENNGGGLRFLVSPSSSRLLFESTLYYSDYRGKFLEQSKRPRITRYNSLEAMFKVFYNGPVFSFLWGTEMNVINTLHTFAGIGNLLQENEYFTTEILTFLDSKIEAARFLIEPGLRLHYYADQSFFAPEPRLKVRYRINDLLSMNFATGLYSQNLVSTTSPEDVVNLFQGYYIGPSWVQDTYRGKYINDKISLAWHAVLGLSFFGPKNLKLSVEGYVKDYYRMINYNRYKMYDLVLNADNVFPEYLIKYFIIEKGWAYGVDCLADWNTASWNLYLAYSLGYVTREDEFTDYVPHFDRRHNLNLVAGYKLGSRKDW
ncbi:MAG: TonB-dependent receptor, partial [Bacteroidia bacterium]|nr:TonB-dependent receptor [Bacteroidia bacterium]